MKKILLIFIISFLFLFFSCEPTNSYSDEKEMDFYSLVKIAVKDNNFTFVYDNVEMPITIHNPDGNIENIMIKAYQDFMLKYEKKKNEEYQLTGVFFNPEKNASYRWGKSLCYSESNTPKLHLTLRKLANTEFNQLDESNVFYGEYVDEKYYMMYTQDEIYLSMNGFELFYNVYGNSLPFISKPSDNPIYNYNASFIGHFYDIGKTEININEIYRFIGEDGVKIIKHFYN